MIIQPKTRGFICTTAHPAGCAEQVKQQINYVGNQSKISGPKNVLVLGASTGYGLASRIVSAFGAGANTIGVYFDRGAEGGRTASAGWYNSAAFEAEAQQAGLKSYSIVGDAFSNEIKAKTVQLIKEQLGKIDLVIYSVASPRRIDPITGEVYNSVIKPLGGTYSNKTVNFHTGEVSVATIESATAEEKEATIKVMGGEDWKLWIEALQEAEVLAEDATTVAYSYIGPAITHAVYRDGTIGAAKNHLEATSHELHEALSKTGGRAFVSVNKALVTQSSAAIPVVPLYMSALFKLMKQENTHEGCIEQIYRLFAERLYTGQEVPVDEKRLIRIDDLEMQPHIQEEVAKVWEQLTTENVYEMTDLVSYRKEFFHLFGFQCDGIDYEADIDPDVSIINSI